IVHSGTLCTQRLGELQHLSAACGAVVDEQPGPVLERHVQGIVEYQVAAATAGGIRPFVTNAEHQWFAGKSRKLVTQQGCTILRSGYKIKGKQCFSLEMRVQDSGVVPCHLWVRGASDHIDEGF